MATQPTTVTNDQKVLQVAAQAMATASRSSQKAFALQAAAATPTAPAGGANPPAAVAIGAAVPAAAAPAAPVVGNTPPVPPVAIPNGGGGAGGGREPFFTRKDLRVFIYFMMMIVAVGLYVIANQLVLKMSRQAMVQPPAASQPAAQAPQDSFPPVTPAAPVQQANTAVYPDTFSCTTAEEVEQGFSRATPVQLNAGQSLHVSDGCLLLQANVPITGLKVSGAYSLDVPVSSVPGNFYKCGNADGLSNSVSSCKDFLSRNGQVRVVVKNGSKIVIN